MLINLLKGTIALYNNEKSTLKGAFYVGFLTMKNVPEPLAIISSLSE